MSSLLMLEALYPEMEEATIARWLVTPGEAVAEDAPLAELITDKVAYEYRSPRTGTLLLVFVPEKSVVPVGTILAAFGEAGDTVENVADVEAENRRLRREHEAKLAAVQQATTAQTPAAETTSRAPAVRATPAARRLARERGIDLATLRGSGPGGMITVEDVDAS